MENDCTKVQDDRVRKYINMAEERLSQAVSLGAPRAVIEKARRYLSDGKHYFEMGDNATALASVSYSHGLLDGCIVPTRGGKEREVQLLARIFVNELLGSTSLGRLASSVGMDKACLMDMIERLRKKGSVEQRGKKIHLTPSGRSRFKVGLVAGVFDLLHPGHLAFLRWAKSHVDVLVAVIARDPNSTIRKGRRPIQSESDRLVLVLQLKPIDFAVLGDHDDIYAPVMKIHPDVIFLGKDQDVDGRRIRAALARRGLNIKVVRSRVWDSGELSKTTKIVDRVARALKG